jgi:G:T-mismatch repair DNA endonuclease (very short patch repair protein)
MAVFGTSTIAAMDAFLRLQTLTTGTASVNATLREILRKGGWSVLVLWECWTRDPVSLRKRLENFFHEADSPE